MFPKEWGCDGALGLRKAQVPGGIRDPAKSCFIVRLGPSRYSIGSERRALLLLLLGRWTLCQAYCKVEVCHGR